MANRLKFIWRYMRPYQKWLWLACVLLPVAAACQLAGPLIIKRAIDEHLTPESRDMLKWDVILLATLYGIEYVSRFGERFSLVRCGVLTLQHLRGSTLDHMLKQPVVFFERKPLGSWVSRMTSDIEALMETLSTGVVTIVSDVLMLVGIFAAMLWLDMHLAWVTLACTAPVWFVVNFYRKHLRKGYDRVRQLTGRMNGTLNETAVGLRELQLFQYQPVMQRRFAETNEKYFRQSMKIVGFDAALYSWVEAMGILTIAVMAGYGIFRFQSGAVSIGILVAYITYIQRFYAPIKELSNKMAVLQGGLAALERLAEVMDHNERRRDGGQRPQAFIPSVRFDQVSFVYEQRRDAAGEDGQSFAALRDVSFDIKPGERVALVGFTGSGKSTLVKLITGMYRPTRGHISFDGKPLEDFDQEYLKERIGMVHQNVHLFADSVNFNIALGHPQVTQQKIEEACRIVRAEDFIRRLPDGYATQLSVDGSNLSQGQRQLLAFARVLAWSPDLVILDEATSSVDSHSEQLIQQAILEVLRRKTTLVIAHRLATVTHVDRILVMSEGRLAQQGTHEELMRRPGQYRDLFEAQMIAQESL